MTTSDHGALSELGYCSDKNQTEVSFMTRGRIYIKTSQESNLTVEEL